jgi:hypothetical protein
MYFQDFPKFLYDFKLGSTNKTTTTVVKDITRNIRFRRDILANIALYDEYDIVDGETPEIIAEKIYGNAEYHWIVMLTNERFDYINDFPLAEPQLVKVIAAKYTNPYAIHHYVDSRGYIVNSDYPGATSVSNSDYERAKNEAKRRIKIVSPQIITTILKNYKDLL